MCAHCDETELNPLIQMKKNTNLFHLHLVSNDQYHIHHQVPPDQC